MSISETRRVQMQTREEWLKEYDPDYIEQPIAQKKQNECSPDNSNISINFIHPNDVPMVFK